jgi:hypothetical protein
VENLPYAISGNPECALSPYNGKNYTNDVLVLHVYRTAIVVYY